MDELSFPRPEDLTDEEWADLSVELEDYADRRYAQVLDARTFAPHLVAHDIVEEVDPDQDDVPAKDRTKTKRDTITDCPDCTRGLIVQGKALVCWSLREAQVDLKALLAQATLHDVIACGRTR